MVFWIPVIAVTILTIIWVLYPLLHQEKEVPASRASYDVQVFKDQLAEIDSDENRAVITPAEAQRVRVEVSRRLLAAAKAAEAEAPPPNAPRTTTYALAAVIAISVALGGLGLYRTYGFPGLPDMPLSENLARQAAFDADRPSQADAEAFVAERMADNNAGLPDLDTLTQSRDSELIDQLAAVLENRPDDLEGYQMLTRALASAGRMIEAHATEDKVLEILGDSATPLDHLEHAELMILAAQGYVSPKAITALDKVMAAIPENPRARYYAGLALAQYGQPRQGYIMWNQLLQEGPEDAPWIAAIRAGIDALAREAGIAVNAPALNGPSAEQVEAAGDMSDGERSDMIRSMVTQLTERLANEGGSVEEWVRLIGANSVLGETDAAQKALEDAKAAYADDEAALARLEAAGARLQ
ncbi:MAG: c-type cytochrome biogenesis protein CcmI [Rhodobacteraceae bacterium]|nr:c-type cytochrome biogenesis protein CcmI [Paracoccaceae bacterium]